MSSRLRLLTTYLEDLPDGLASYPECRARGALLRPAMKTPLSKEAAVSAQLPNRIAEILTRMPTNSGWITEVECLAAYFALADLRGQDEESMLKQDRQIARDLFASPAMRLVMTFASPELLVIMSSAYWKTMYSGSTLVTRSRSTRSVIFELNYPPRLYSMLAVQSIAISIEVALELAGAQRPVTSLEWTEKQSVICIHWK